MRSAQLLALSLLLSPSAQAQSLESAVGEALALMSAPKPPPAKKLSLWCEAELNKVAATEAEIAGLDAGDQTKALLRKMSGNAKESVELACGLKKVPAVDWCQDNLKQVEQSAERIASMNESAETKKILLQMNANARKSVELACAKPA